MPPHPLTLLEAQAWVLIISALVTAALSIITAIVTAILLVRTGRIHTLVNSALDKEKLKITMLESLLMAKQLELDAAEKARLALAATVTPAAMAAGSPVPPLDVQPS